MGNCLKFITMIQIYLPKYSTGWKSLEIDAGKRRFTTKIQNGATTSRWFFTEISNSITVYIKWIR